MSKRCYCTILLSFIFFPFSLQSVHIVFPFLCVHVPVSPCPSGFHWFFFSISLSLSASFSLVLRTRRWHGAWPDKVIPQRRGLPGRDSLDTVSPLLARCRLQRGRETHAPVRREEGRGRNGGSGKRQEERDWAKKGAFGNQRMEPMFKYIHSSSIDHFVNEARRRGQFLIDFVLSLSLSTSVKSWRKFAGSGWMRCTPRRKSVLTHFPRCVSYLEKATHTHTHALYSTTSEAYTSAINRHTHTHTHPDLVPQDFAALR